MTIITTLSDLVHYVDTVTQFYDRADDDVSEIVQRILALGRRPAYGEDWDAFLRMLPDQVFQASARQNNDQKGV